MRARVTSDNESILLEVVPSSTIGEVQGLVSKDEYHVTLVGRKFLKTAWIRQLGHDRIYDILCQIPYTFDFSVTWEDRISMVKKMRDNGTTEKSVVQWCKVEGIEKLYAWLSGKLQIEIKPPPMHCTLLVQETDGVKSRGVSITTLDDPTLYIEDIRTPEIPAPTGRRIVLPDEDDGNQILKSVRETWVDKSGAKYTKLVGIALKSVCDAYLLDPEKLAEQVSANVRDFDDGDQLAIVAYDCPKDSKENTRYNLGPRCRGHLHISYMPSDCRSHYKILAWSGSAVDVCRKLRQYFSPVTTGRRMVTGGVVPSDLASLEQRVGLADFMKGD